MSARALLALALCVACCGSRTLAQPSGNCLWDNGGAPERAEFDGELSHLGGGMPTGAMAADDFSLCEGQVHRLRSISVVLATNAVDGLEKAKLQVYDDCRGAPGKLLFKLKQFHTQDLDTLDDGYRLVRFTFVFDEQEDPEVRRTVLHGGTYWLVAVGLTDNQPDNLTFWAKSVTGVKGRPAMKTLGVAGGPTWDDFLFPDPWESVGECCIGCVDLAFSIEGGSCKVLFDNGPADISGSAGGLASEVSTGSRDSRAAGDFVLPPCRELNICYIEGCIFTNCQDFTPIAYVFPNGCKLPSELPGWPVLEAKGNIVQDLGFTMTYQGRTLRAYRVGFDLFDGGLPLQGGSYWLSIGVLDTFSSEERALMCYASRCGTDCQTRFNPAAYIDMIPPIGVPPSPHTRTGEWQLATRDVSFLIAGEAFPGRGADPHAGADPMTPTCTADADQDGRVSVNDLFAFLVAFFAGCP